MGWYIALTEPGADGIAFDALRRRNYTVYRPVIPVNLRHGRGRLRRVMRSMFPGYLLVIDSACQGWLRLRNAPGIRVSRSLMMASGHLTTLSDEVVEEIRATEQDLCAKIVIRSNGTDLRVGQTVKIQINPVTELLGAIENLDDLERICVLTKLLGRDSRVKVSQSLLMAV